MEIIVVLDGVDKNIFVVFEIFKFKFLLIIVFEFFMLKEIVQCIFMSQNNLKYQLFDLYMM